MRSTHPLFLLNPMKTKHLALIAFAALLWACTEEPVNEKGDPAGTQYYTESFDQFPNPERGFYGGGYYTSKDSKEMAAASVKNERNGSFCTTLFLDSYYLTDYISSDIPQWFLNRIDQNLAAYRNGGAKCILRFAYKSDNDDDAKPWDATPQWVNRHIDQITPYLQKNSDVILCLQAGFIGVWGEWYYTTGYTMGPTSDADYEPRWAMLDHLLSALPADRQVCVRTPTFKRRYLKQRGLSTEPLTAEEAYQPTAKARIAAHNDCFIASANDWGTYTETGDREFWEEDTRYTVMGGETCHECSYSLGDNAILQMETYHWTYLNKSYHPGVLSSWEETNHMDEVKRRLGYRFVMDKAYLTQQPKAGQAFSAKLSIRNVGFAAPVNKRLVELVFVSCADSGVKRVFRIDDADPRFWMAGETQNVELRCTLDTDMQGDWRVYLNLPDPYDSLHDNPDFSIRLANVGTWEAKTGYNLIDFVTIQ